MKGNDFEKLLVQINDSIGVLGDKVEKVGKEYSKGQFVISPNWNDCARFIL